MHILKHTTSVGTFYATEDSCTTKEADALRFYSFRAAKAKDADLKRAIKRSHPDVNFFSSEVEEVADYTAPAVVDLPAVAVEQVQTHSDDLVEMVVAPEQQALAYPRAQALAQYKGAAIDEVSIDEHCPEVLEHDGEGWLVLTDAEATEHAEAYIKDSLWAFNPSFIKHYMPLKNEKAIAMIQENCEGANEEFLDMVGDNLQALMDDAISTDGRAHFLNTYDGNEYYEQVGDTTYYLYRIN